MDVSEATFESDVIERSTVVPVLVDFWADWCGPCHALAPVLEAAVAERGGAVALVKVDVDGEQALSQRFGVSGIPAVKAFREGKIVAEFSGARSRVAVDTFLDELLAPPRALALVEELRESGALPEVVAALDASDLEGALRWLVDAVPRVPAAERDRLREVAVAIFDQMGPDDETAARYRRRLAAALF